MAGKLRSRRTNAKIRHERAGHRECSTPPTLAVILRRMSTALAWGILGTGNIARQFCTGLKSSSRTRLAAVASRSPESAKTFAAAFAIPAAHGSYEALLA